MTTSIPGLIRSIWDAETNSHPYPILVHPDWFRTLCIACGATPVGPPRSTIQVAIADRITHQESHP